MKILGIDPGLTQTGYGIIQAVGDNVEMIDYGVIEIPKKESLNIRLHTIFFDVCEIIKKYKPQIFVIEEVFFGKNAKSALMLGHARGAAMVSATHNNLVVYEFSAKKIKQSITGNGNADKKQIQFMVKNILNLRELPYPIDASDALAVALCYCQNSRLDL